MTVRILTGDFAVDTLGRRYVIRRHDRRCQQCNGPISRRGSKVRFCSKKCHGLSLKGYFPNRKTPATTRVALNCNRCGMLLHRKPSAIKVEATYCSRACSNAQNLDRFSTRMAFAPTSLERLLYAFLSDHGIPFEPQRRIGEFVVDAYLPGPRVAVEVDGEYWHSLPENQARDRRKDEALESYGIGLVRIPERLARADIGAPFRKAGLCL